MREEMAKVHWTSAFARCPSPCKQKNPPKHKEALGVGLRPMLTSLQKEEPPKYMRNKTH